MLRHSQIWSAIDALAQANGMSPSGLARRAGLDPTTFNRSKRITSAGRERWPSTESVAKVLAATGTSLAAFVAYVDSGGEASRHIPVIGYAQAGEAGYFDDAGYPAGMGWDEVSFPELGDAHAYALEISGDSMAPVYRDGDLVVVSPAAPVRRGDRVVVRTREGEVMAKQLARRTPLRVELVSLNTQHADRMLATEDIAWLHRILWVSQ